VLTGTPGDDVLDGKAGNDVLGGLAGSGLLLGGPGRRRLARGLGADRVLAFDDGARGTVQCGPGRETVNADGWKRPPANGSA
jgi:Ca2+-binding RTX toxin-like protein